MQIQFEVSGLDEIVQKTQAFNSDALSLIQQAILQSIEEAVIPIAKSLAPVRTGALRESIGAAPGEPPIVYVEATKFYAPFLEFGTRYIPEGKYSFLRPAMQEGMEAIVQAIERVMISIFTQ
jgi:HK97 gp10 family phage protein